MTRNKNKESFYLKFVPPGEIILQCCRRGALGTKPPSLSSGTPSTLENQYFIVHTIKLNYTTFCV